jgi:hypothetical protein
MAEGERKSFSIPNPMTRGETVTRHGDAETITRGSVQINNPSLAGEVKTDSARYVKAEMSADGKLGPSTPITAEEAHRQRLLPERDSGAEVAVLRRDREAAKARSVERQRRELGLDA